MNSQYTMGNQGTKDAPVAAASVGGANELYAEEFYDKAVRTAVSSSIISKKGNVCPFTVRLAWHAAGTFDKKDQSGGSDGATMRFDKELNNPANAGLGIPQGLLGPLKEKFPDLSTADLWCLAGVQAIKLCGGPDVPFNYGRTDAADDTACPPNDRLPDAAQGAQHLRDIFYRMGFDDKDIVALSGAHTLGSCHEMRSGYDGPWTHNPLKFDNEYYKLLLSEDWKPRKWNGPLQYSDASGQLMMLPSDLALIKDEKFLPYVKAYAADEELFFKDFADVFGRLLSLGCPAKCQPNAPKEPVPGSAKDKAFRDLCMHGSVERIKAISKGVNVNAKEYQSERTALHKAAFFGHDKVIEYLIKLGAFVNAQDADGDTPLHDAAQLGHVSAVKGLLLNKANKKLKNKDGKTAFDKAKVNGHSEVMKLLA